jgi:hypothetical protein
VIREKYIESSDLRETLLRVAGAARERVMIISPRVEPAALEALRAVLRPDVQVEVVSDPGSHLKLLVADRRVAMILSTNMTVIGTGLGFIPTIDVDTGLMCEPNIECGYLIKDPGAVAKLLDAGSA